MENNETIIEVRGISIKEGKSGNQYFSIETDQGIVTCFEKKITDELQKNVGNKVKAEIVTNDRGFRNVRKFLGLATKEEAASQLKNAGSADLDIFSVARTEKNKSMFVSYAKDIFLEIYARQCEAAKMGMAGETEMAIMNKAVQLVKIAIQAFDNQEEVITD